MHKKLPPKGPSMNKARQRRPRAPKSAIHSSKTVKVVQNKPQILKKHLDATKLTPNELAGIAESADELIASINKIK